MVKKCDNVMNEIQAPCVDRRDRDGVDLMVAHLTSEERDNTPCYIARTTNPTKRHPIVGTAVCAIVDDGTRVKETAKEVAAWIRDRLVIERVPVWWVRLHLFTAEPYRIGPLDPGLTDAGRAAIKAARG